MRHLLFATGAAGIALAALLAPAPADAQVRTAQGYGYYGSEEPLGYGAPYGGRVRSERVCQRWCPQDFTPCDPPNFKIADGRCRPTFSRP